MHIEYQISEDDFVSASELFLKTRRKPMFRRRFVRRASLVVYGFFVFIILYSAKAWDPLLLLLLIPALIPARQLLARWQLRRSFRNTPILHGRWTLDVDAEGLHFTSPSSEGTTTWEPFIGFAENDQTFIVVQQGNRIYSPIPKRELTLPKIEELRAFFATHLPRR